MTDLLMSSHAERRINQRGLSIGDIKLIHDHGSEVEGGFLLTDKAVRQAISDMRRKIIRLEHLAGKRLVCEGDTVITAYHPTDKKMSRILRRSAKRNL
jgi:hypothetical protein